MKAAIYCRFSPRPNAKECESIETQLRDLRQHAEKQGYTIVGEFTDPEMSGDDEERPGLWQAMGALKKGYVLLVWKGDRLARSVYLSEYLHRDAASKGARIEYLHGRNGESADDVLVRQILASVDEHAKKVNAIRTKLMMLSRQSNGQRMSRFAPFGRQFILETGEPSKRPTKHHGPCAAELAAIERIKSLKAEGYGSLRIKQQLEALKILCRGNPWHRSTIEKILARASRGH